MALPPLILIPGLLNDAELWRDQIAVLADIADCRVADITQGESLEALAQSVLAQAPPRFALAGFSLGGYVAVEMARIAAERIGRLALLDTSIQPDDPERAVARQVRDKAARAPGTFHGFGDRLLKTYLGEANLHDEHIVGRIRGMTQRLGAEVFLRQNSILRKDGAGVLAGLTCPVLILCGEEDRLTPLAEHEAMASLVPQARLVAVPGSGHMTPIENPEAVNAALRNWLQSGR
ncbi:alpha/beta hydrolase [Bosea sp. WAO]|uniref:alpha/beta fold hydrolase n=1 Tax=Bosea sp. WAO TaxID=406341 RepID=UPI000747E8E9|nr:alpha/beta hydrolase [Bosea sp. WAO]KUL94584.1 alpha/beta hydrolase [Bosea sp. WAO]